MIMTPGLTNEKVFIQKNGVSAKKLFLPFSQGLAYNMKRVMNIMGSEALMKAVAT